MEIYKPCCELACLVAGCKTRESGGCYCLCKLIDKKNDLTSNSIIAKTVFNNRGGEIYFSDQEKAEKYRDSLDEESKRIDREFRIKIPDLLVELEDLIKSYLI